MFDSRSVTQRNFQSLSIRDLVEARDLYHFHLMDKANVVGTAVGLYLIRKDDPWPSEDRKEELRHNKGERNIENSEVRPYSWPAVLVFVDQWVDEAKFSAVGELPADQMVPKTLYLPDGRMVPV